MKAGVILSHSIATIVWLWCQLNIKFSKRPFCIFNKEFLNKDKFCSPDVLFSHKVHIFWEGHNFLQSLKRRFVLCFNGQIYNGILQDFVAFSEYMNFSLHTTPEGTILLFRFFTFLCDISISCCLFKVSTVIALLFGILKRYPNLWITFLVLKMCILPQETQRPMVTVWNVLPVDQVTKSTEYTRFLFLTLTLRNTPKHNSWLVYSKE